MSMSAYRTSAPPLPGPDRDRRAGGRVVSARRPTGAWRSTSIMRARKTWGGNHTNASARAQQILASVLRTCRQPQKDPFPRLVALQCSPVAQCLDLVPTAHAP